MKVTVSSVLAASPVRLVITYLAKGVPLISGVTEAALKSMVFLACVGNTRYFHFEGGHFGGEAGFVHQDSHLAFAVGNQFEELSRR